MSFSWEKTISDEEDGQLLRQVLRRSIGLSRRMLNALKFEGSIRINGQQANVRQRVSAGDHITLHLPQSMGERVIPERMPLEIVFEDDDLLIVEKPPGVIVHPIPPEPTGTLANAIAWYWQEMGLDLPVRIVTRLDRDTSGLVLIAKHALAQHYYSRSGNSLTKFYFALVHGQPAESDGLITAPIGINHDNPATRQIDPLGKPAQTAWRLVSTNGKYSLIEAQLLTGRTHQIRVHLAWLGHPLMGDRQYGCVHPALRRQALHCHRLGFSHVRSGENLQFVSPLPHDLQGFCDTVGLKNLWDTN